MSGFKCPTCSESFSQRTALCEDWRIPEKSFGCPHCSTFHVIEYTKHHWSEHVIGVTAVIVLAIDFFDTPLTNTVATPLILATGASVYFYFKWKNRKHASWLLVPVPEQAP